MNTRIRAFGAFWYDFIVGDDWRVAACVVAALVITAIVSLSSIPAWWIMPVAVAVVLPFSVWRARRR
ncbi:MAG: hypothetical protein ACRDSH_04535 [Pseudonocardiaceae bacterium]